MTTLLAPDDIRGFSPETALSDESLQLLIDAAEAEMIRFAGPLDEAVEWHAGGQRVIALNRHIDSVTSIVEFSPWDTESTTLDATDYEIDPTGFLIYRRGGGTHSRWRWWGRVVVTFAPADEEAIRTGVELDLVRLMMTYQPGASSETVGSWTTQLSSNSVWNNDKERASILSRLISHGRMLVVGG